MQKANIGKMRCLCYVFPEGRIFNKTYPDSYPEGWVDLDMLMETLEDRKCCPCIFINLTEKHSMLQQKDQMCYTTHYLLFKFNIIFVESHKYNGWLWWRSGSVSVLGPNTIFVIGCINYFCYYTEYTDSQTELAGPYKTSIESHTQIRCLTSLTYTAGHRLNINHWSLLNHVSVITVSMLFN